MTRGIRTLLAGGGVAMLAFVVAAAPAGAVKKHAKLGPVVVGTQTAVAFGDAAIARARAVCPPRTRIVGGGYSETPPFDISGDGFVGEVFESVKVGNSSWRVAAQNQDPGPPNTLVLTAFAYCRRNAPKTGTASATISGATPSQVQPAANARCTHGQGVSGGFYATPPQLSGASQGLVAASLPAPRAGWRANMLGLSAADASTAVTSLAYCATPPRGPRFVSNSVVGPSVSEGSAPSSVSAICPGKRTPVAGGFTQDAGGSFFAVYESQRIDDSWRVSGIHSGIGATSLTSVAGCG